MTATTEPLATLAQRIAQQQQDLASLRQEYETRQARLADLTQRKKDLEAKLHQIDGEIRAVGGAGKAAPGPKPKAPEPSAKPSAAAPTGAPKLTHMLVGLVRKAKEPISITELADAIVRRKFPTKSTNVPALVKSTAQKLVTRGILIRTTNPPGLVLSSARSDKQASPAVEKSAKAKPAKGPKMKKAAASAKPESQEKSPPLRVVLTNILAKSTKPLTAKELADAALATGYQTKSDNFTNVIWVALGKMDNIQNLAGKGWRLKGK